MAHARLTERIGRKYIHIHPEFKKADLRQGHSEKKEKLTFFALYKLRLTVKILKCFNFTLFLFHGLPSPLEMQRPCLSITDYILGHSRLTNCPQWKTVKVQSSLTA